MVGIFCILYKVHAIDGHISPVATGCLPNSIHNCCKHFAVLSAASLMKTKPKLQECQTSSANSTLCAIPTPNPGVSTLCRAVPCHVD